MEAEKQVDLACKLSKGKATSYRTSFAAIKNGKTPLVVEGIVTDIDGIVRMVRFPCWPSTNAGKHEVQKALRKVIYVKYEIKGQDLFDKALANTLQHY